jgi:hypothetical protein
VKWLSQRIGDGDGDADGDGDGDGDDDGDGDSDGDGDREGDNKVYGDVGTIGIGVPRPTTRFFLRSASS